MKFHSNIEPPKDGWMRFRFHGHGDEIDILASYTPNDPFYEFVTAMQALLSYGSSNQIRMNEEPCESTLTIEKSEESLVLTLSRNGESSYIKTSFHSGCREIARNIHHLYNDVGYEGFVQDWRHSPPKEQITQLWAEFSKL